MLVIRPVMNSRTANILLLVLNLGLVATIAWLTVLLRSKPTPSVSYLTETKTVTNIAVRKVNPPLNIAGLLNRPLSWSALEATNYVTFINNLRDFGCPEETIQDIIIADIAKLYAKRRTQLRAQLPAHQYWQPLSTWGARSAEHQEIQRQLRELDIEQRALIKELLGVDFQAELAKYTSSEEVTQPDYGFLPEEKRQQVTDLLKRFEDLEADLYGRTGGLMLAEDEAELRSLQKQREEELSKVLSTEEFEQYQLRNSPTAQNLRAQMEGFEATEEEFRKLFRLQKVYDDKLNPSAADDDGPDSEARQQAQAEAQRALNDEIKKTLGEARYAQYQRAQDLDYRTLTQMAERFGLTGDVAGKVYDMKVAAEKQKQVVSQDASLSEDQRLAALLGIVSETERSVGRVLGEDVYKKYQKVGGSWIRRLGDLPSAGEFDFDYTQ